MSVREHDFSLTVAEAPAWARRGVARFGELQAGEPEGTGTSPSAFLVDGAARYYPNVGQPLGGGVIGVLLSGVALCAFVIVAVVQLTTTEAVASWTYAAIGASAAAIAISFAFVVGGSRPLAKRTDGLYLLPEGLVVVRKGRCACHAREEIAVFRTLSTSGGSSARSYHEGVELTNGVVMPLVAGKHSGLRREWESWRTDA